MQRTNKTLQIQGTAMKSLGNQMGQIVEALLERPCQVILRLTLKERVKPITTSSGVQLTKINLKRSVATNEKVHSASEEHFEDFG